MNSKRIYLCFSTAMSERNFTVDFSFSPKGNYRAEIMQDGVNASNNGNDYKRTVQKISNGSKLAIGLAPGGGCAVIIEKVN